MSGPKKEVLVYGDRGPEFREPVEVYYEPDAVAELVAASEVLRAEWDRQDNGKFDAMPAKEFFAAEARWRAALAKFEEGA